MDARLLLTLVLIALVKGEKEDPPPTRSRPGKYVPELHGGAGWYVPDNSGKYRHDPRPYDGGYGDRGEPYSADLRGIFRKAEEQLEARVQEASERLFLGPRDHLRFMIDFNFNGTGWQIIEFQWVRDGDESHQDSKQISYLNENKLWENGHGDQSYDYQQPAEECEESCQSGYKDPVPEPFSEPEQEKTPSTNINSEKDPIKVYNTINEVLEYIQQHILPTLT
ncbi:uncharacterized protein [Drosophila bipectinata]|uniref:uncharacterized protein n=1 Tax=Drosophila bipectinata TaxID=42026 RepID=UPI001C8A6D1D|nr:uncharacterized protein LOC108133775 [Drosophila bipectinata]